MRLAATVLCWAPLLLGGCTRPHTALVKTPVRSVIPAGVDRTVPDGGMDDALLRVCGYERVVDGVVDAPIALCP